LDDCWNCGDRRWDFSRAPRGVAGRGDCRLLKRLRITPVQWVGAGILTLTFWVGVPRINDVVETLASQKIDNLLAFHTIEKTDENVAMTRRIYQHYQDMAKYGFVIGSAVTGVSAVAMSMVFGDRFSSMTLTQKRQFAETLLAEIEQIELEKQVMEALKLKP